MTIWTVNRRIAPGVVCIGPVQWYFAVPGDPENATASTTALGVNDKDEVVGVYVPSGNLNALDGFTWTPRGGFTTVNDPNGVGTTTINGVNDFGDLVGFYVDGNGNTDGMLAIPHGS